MTLSYFNQKKKRWAWYRIVGVIFVALSLCQLCRLHHKLSWNALQSHHRWADAGQPPLDPTPDKDASIIPRRNTTTTTTKRRTRTFATKARSPPGNDDVQDEAAFRFNEIIRNTTRLLYEESDDLDYWLEQPVPRIYVYDNLPKDWTDARTIGDCIDRMFWCNNNEHKENASSAMSQTTTTTRRTPNTCINETNSSSSCRWYPIICGDNAKTADPPEAHHNNNKKRIGQAYVVWRYNFNVEVALLELFERYPARTYNPLEADYFVVPYPYLSHCTCGIHSPQGLWTHGGKFVCPYSQKDIERNVLSKLTYFYNNNNNSSSNNNNVSTEQQRRHIFLFGLDTFMIDPAVLQEISSKATMLMLGPSLCHRHNSTSCHSLVVPYLSTVPEVQPGVVLNQGWWDGYPQNRTHALTAGFGLPYLVSFRRTFWEQRRGLGKSLGGRNVTVLSFGHERRVGRVDDMMQQLYPQTLVCPVLPGDTAVQKRFYDVLLRGCIPLLPVWNCSNDPPSLSAHQECGDSLTNSLAFARDNNNNSPSKVGIDYLRDVVVTYKANCGIWCVKQTVKRLVANQTELNRLFANAKKYAPLFSYGLENNMFRHVDAFSAIIVQLRHKLFNPRG